MILPTTMLGQEDLQEMSCGIHFLPQCFNNLSTACELIFAMFLQYAMRGLGRITIIHYLHGPHNAVSSAEGDARKRYFFTHLSQAYMGNR